MIWTSLISLWRRVLRFCTIACVICLLALALLRLGAWGLLGASVHEDLAGPPQIFTWDVDHADFGGMSALLMAADGQSLVAGGDHGVLVEAAVTRTPAGEIAALGPAELYPVKLRSGRPPTAFKMDLEALTRDPRQGWLVAYESFVRIERLSHASALPRATHPWEQFAALFGNQAFEALATLPDGRVMAITERRGPAASVIWDGTSWTRGPDIPVSPGYRITGADLGPDGCLYLLERRYSLVGGFRFGLRRLSGGPDAWEDTLLYRAAPARLGNAEGLGTWQTPEGGVAFSIVTDNGFLPLTATRLIELRAQAPAACSLKI